ncbi:type II secretion system F family protein [Longitalea arenae]|uniref:type II secretion system F family protein n=1 Tax=Longitalea arenae TaxID=2812558 RepID=UPI001967A733|nr:type II secretion system F family protein [Longitalea arenae]
MNEPLDIRKIKARQVVNVPGKAAPPEATTGIWGFLNKDIQLGGDRLPDTVKENFYLELSTLLEAGIDIRTALELIKNEQKKKKAKALFDEILQLVINGTTLSEALKSKRQFTSYEYFSVQIGEETGKLLQVLKELAVFFQKKIKQRRQVTGALMYPAVVLVVAFSAAGFLLTYVVPMFSDVFKRFGSDLPAVTKAVISLSGFLKKYAGSFFLFLVTLVTVIIWQRKHNSFRRIYTNALLKIPVVGVIIQKIYLSRFANTMALLVGAKIPIVQAIQLTRQMITFYPIEQSLAVIEEKIIAGQTLHKSLSAFSVYPPKMVSMIKVGEEVNQLELFFARIATQYSNEVEYQANMLNKLLEPLIIVVLGLIVAVVLIAMYLPLFKLGQGF